MNDKIHRRAAIAKAFAGVVGGSYALDMFARKGWLEALLPGPIVGGPASIDAALRLGAAGRAPLGTYEILGAALRGGAGLVRAQQAFAVSGASDPSKEWSVVTIKVVNHVHTPLVFKLGKLDEATGAVMTGADVGKVVDKLTGAKALLESGGVDRLSDIPRFRELRFNQWFARMLQEGKSDSLSAAGVPALDAATIFPGAGPFPPPDEVALQAGLHLVQEFTTKNHSLLNFRLRQNEGDLAHFVEKYGIINSPLGVTSFMMGDVYDKAEGSFDVNVVLGDSPGVETPVARGRPVQQLVQIIEQSLGGGYGDDAPFDESLTVRFDKLVERDPQLRRAMIDSKALLAQALVDLKRIGALESTAQTGVGAESGSLQSGGKADVPATVARQEFVAQCAYTARALQLDGRPIRNFSLFLNNSDLDGNNLDAPFFGGGADGVKCYTYVEGMRQLAVGLNILAKVVAQKRNVVVVVLSEGGRNEKLGDDHVGFGMVLAPAGAGMLTDHLYANRNLMNQASNTLVRAPGALVDPNDMSTWVRWDGEGLVSDAGASMKGNRATSSGDWQLGVAEFLAEKMGVENKMAGQLQYVKLKRG
jgi:hypothetical protein